jgi:putative transcriptional regulator
MNNRRPPTDALSGTELGRKLLQSVKEMKVGQAARATKVEPNAVPDERQQTGLSQAQSDRCGNGSMAAALSGQA